MSDNRKITFITGNAGKLAEVQAIMPFVVGKQIDLPELQAIDLQTVVAAKLDAALLQCPGPVMVDDTAMYLACFASKDGSDGLPGPLIKWFLKTVTNEGLANRADKLGNTRARVCTMIGYADQDGNRHFFKGSVSGFVVAPQGTSGFGWDHIFLPDGHAQTFAAMGMENKNKISQRSLALQKLQQFLAV